MNANLTVVELIRHQSFSLSRLAQRRKQLNRLPFLRPVQATRKIRFQRLVPEAEAWMAMEDILDNLIRKFQPDNPIMSHRCRDLLRSQPHRPLILQVNIRFLYFFS